MQVGRILSELYHNLRKEHYDPNMLLHHSDVYYVRAGLLAHTWVILTGNAPQVVQDAVRKMPLEDLGKILREEGLLKYYEYGIPRWYAKKWLQEGLTHKQAVDRIQRIQRKHA